MHRPGEKTVVIDCFPEAAKTYAGRFAIVAIDVIRATTTAVTAVNAGRRCFPVPSVERAWSLARELPHPLLAGELGGVMPGGFDLNNSPAGIAARDDTERPVILLSSSGTSLLHEARSARAVYAACFRNFRAVAEHAAGRHSAVALIGAGSGDEFREEDKLCCAWIARALLNRGYKALDRRTVDIVRTWGELPVEACLMSNSVNYLARSNQRHDLEFIFTHVDDIDAAALFTDGEVVPAPLLPAFDGRFAMQESGEVTLR